MFDSSRQQLLKYVYYVVHYFAKSHSTSFCAKDDPITFFQKGELNGCSQTHYVRNPTND